MAKRRTLNQIYKELVSSPFFPLLFIGKAVETAVIEYANVEPTISLTIMAIIATVLWALSDSVDVEFDSGSFVGTDEEDA